MTTQIIHRADDQLTPVLTAGTDNLVHVAQDLNPGYYQENHSNNSALKKAFDTANALRKDFTNHHDRRLHRNPKQTLAQHCDDMKRDLQSLDDRTVRRLTSAYSELQREIKSTQMSLDDDAHLDANKEYINAVTGAFYGLSPAKKQEMISKLIEDGEGSDLAILINSSQLLTGLGRKERELIRRRVHEKANPDGVKLLDQLQEAAERWDRGGLGAIRTLQKLGEGLNRYDAEIARAEAVTRQPLANFSA